jgi:putative PEP-CTERM system TPR-repeat lipoprotein
MRIRNCISGLVVALVLCSAAGCRRDPDAAKRTYLESGNRYYEQKRFGEAVVEFRNAVNVDPSFGEAYERLSEALIESSDVPGAARALLRAADLLPNRVDLQLKAGNLLLLAGRFDDARVRADKVIAAEPKNIPAQILRANALAGLRDLERALVEIEQAIALDPERAPTFTALGVIQSARGENAEAETAFRRAVELDPKAVTARLALGNFLWTSNRPAEAEAAFREAARIDPANRLVNRALATYYLATSRTPEAEKFLLTLAEDDRDPSAVFALADYYVMVKRYDEAVAALSPLTADRNRGPAARLRIARIKYSQHDTAQAYRIVDEVIAQNPGSSPALLTRARFLVGENKYAEALDLAKRATQADMSSAEAEYVLGTINVRLQHPEDARRAFNRVLELNPRATAAQVQLANLELSSGNPAASVQHAQDAVTSQPQNASARFLLARSHLAANNLDGAERELKILAAAHPRWSAVHSTMGMVQMRRQNPAAARQAFATALSLDKNAIEPFAGLVAAEVGNGRTSEARRLLAERLAANPTDRDTVLMAARAYALMREYDRAETLLKQLVDRDPANLNAYSSLAQIYMAQGQLDAARASFERVAQQKPDSASAQTMVGVLLQAQHRTADAVPRYELALRADNRSAVAANNLAWIYAEQGRNLETALQLARTAKQAQPDRAEISDTLGFVYMKRGAYDLAVGALRDAVSQAPENPQFRLRLGIALAKAGRMEEAKRIIVPVIQGNPGLPDAAEARAVLR